MAFRSYHKRRQRQTGDVLLRLNLNERRILDFEAERLDLDRNDYLRRLLMAAHRQQFVPPPDVDRG